MPQIRYGLRLVSMQSSILAIGGIGNGEYQNEVLELQCLNEGIPYYCEWKVKQQLIDSRAYFLAFHTFDASLSCE